MKLDGKRVAITGGTGLIGEALARHLLERGCQVETVSRRGVRGAGMPDGVAARKGDVTDPASLDFSEADVVIHAAAWVGFGLPPAKRQLMLDTNVGGTVNVLAAAAKADVERVLHVSSVAALGRKFKEPATEALADEPRTRFQSTYERSKYEAHQVALHGDHGVDVVAVQPSVVLGIGDTSSGLLLKRYLQGKLPVVLTGDRPTGYVHVEDVAAGSLQVLEQGEGAYILSDRSLTQEGLMSLFEATTGVAAPRRRFPMDALWPVAAGLDLAGRFTGKRADLGLELLRGLKAPMHYDTTKARTLGWQPDLEGHLKADAARWQET
ncbi:MAG: NAD-dependent epimerase/dehydratase family protein [Thermoplasmatota archaeon]